ELAERLGKGKNFSHLKTARDVADEFRLASKGGNADYYGATWDKIDKQDGVFWPCTDEADEGTPHMFLDKNSIIRMVARKYSPFHIVHRQKSHAKTTQSV